jgi:hypothetical protein
MLNELARRKNIPDDMAYWIYAAWKKQKTKPTL